MHSGRRKMAGRGASSLSMASSHAVTVVVVLVLMAVIRPSAQFTLIHRTPRAQHGDAISVHGKLVANDNTYQPDPLYLHHHQQPDLLPLPHHQQASPLSFHQGPHSASLATSDSDTLSILPPQAHTQPATNFRKTNHHGGEENFQTRHRFGTTPTQSRGSTGEPDAEAALNLKRDGLGKVGESTRKQTVVVGRSRSKHQQIATSSKTPDKQRGGSPVDPDIRLTKVVQVELNGGEFAQTSGNFQREPAEPLPGGADEKLPGGGSSVESAGSNSEVLLKGSGQWSDKAVVVEEEGESQSLQLPVAHGEGDTHVSKMVLTVIGSLTAILGVCVMAAIFQCCCRRKRSSSTEEKDQDQKSSRSSRSSKSPSPQKVLVKDVEDEETEKGQSEQDKLLAEEDEDLGDFSVVQRETDILRSYRKPPPPKNRARASRVPRALKTVDPKASPNVFQELLESEEGITTATNQTPQKATNGLTSPETMSPEMHSSMLDDIDSTIAAMHVKDDKSTPSPSKSVDRSREPSAEKLHVAKNSGDSSQLKSATPKNGSDNSQLKPRAKESPPKSLPTSPSREELAKALVQELSRSVSKEMLSKPQSKASTPKTSKETTPKSQSAGASPKPVHNKNPSASPSKDSVGSSSNGGSAKQGLSPEEEEDKKEAGGNIFVLIDPTTKDKANDAGGKSKIPVRAASSPTQPTAPLRFSAGKDKRFPVPSVHGDQMDQLLKSLKTRLKEDDGANPKQPSNKVSSEEESAHDDEDLDPQGRDRSHSDPTRQQAEKGEKPHQTHL